MIIEDSLSVYTERYIEIGNKNSNQTFNNIKEIKNAKIKNAYSFTYQYSNYKSKDINKIEIHFYDLKREITITGANYIQIQSTIDYLEKRFLEHREIITGFGIRCILTSLLLIISFILGLGLSIKRNKNNYELTRTYVAWKSYLSIVLSLIFFLAIIDVINLKIIFPGFEIIQNDSDFLSRNANLFTFLSFILGLFGWSIRGLLRKKK
jgi:hypothetical protein